MAGLACADSLVAWGHTITLFDKGRGPGGRMSTRRVETPLGETGFDHGAQYFTARSAAFQQQVQAWQNAGIVAHWPAAGDHAYVGTPAMNAPIKAIAARHDVHWATRIIELDQRDNEWVLGTESGEHGPYDGIIIAVPAEQVSDLVEVHQPDFARAASAVQSAPCWTVMLAFDAPLSDMPDTIRNLPPIGWAARNNAKPGRAYIESWVVQADPEWSATHLEDAADAIIAAMTEALEKAGRIVLPKPIIAQAHRWRYAMVPKRSDADATPFLWDAEKQIGLCGDWLSGPRIENAWLSGRALAEAI